MWDSLFLWVRRCSLGHWSPRRGMVSHNPRMDSHCLGKFDRWHSARSLVVLRGVGLGRLLGLGSGRKCVAASVVDRHGVPALGDSARTPRNVASLEFVASPRNVCAYDFWHFLDAPGVIDSVHEFSASSLGPLLLGLFATIVILSVALVGWRGDQLRSPGSIDSPVSREGAFLANNLLFTLVAFIILLGTVFPLIVEAINNDQLAVGRPYFDRMLLPLGIALLLVMGVAPLLTWRSTNGHLLELVTLRPGLRVGCVNDGCGCMAWSRGPRPGPRYRSWRICYRFRGSSSCVNGSKAGLASRHG